MSATMLAASVATSLTSSGQTQTGEAVLFWFLAPVMVLAALGLLFSRKTVHAAMSVVLVMISLAILYIAQDAPFLGVVQVIVYTGAVMMLFLFVLMLVGVDSSDSFVETITGQRWIGFLLGGGLAVVLVGVVLNAAGLKPTGLEQANSGGNPARVGELIFGHYLFAMEVVGTLLVTAAVGAIVMTHRQRLTPAVGQRERAAARIAGIARGEILTPLPAPGVYASSNALDVAALGPDGLPLEPSVPRVLRIRGQERSIDEVHASTDASSSPGVGPAPSAPALPEETQS